MLEFLRGKTSFRKLRLFACACCRRLRLVVKNKTLRGLIETIELYADGLATTKDFLPFSREYEQGREKICGAGAVFRAAGSAQDLYPRVSKQEAAYRAASDTVEMCLGPFTWKEKVDRKRAVLSQVLRDITGNPFHPVAFNPDWLTSTVKALAKAFYAEQHFDDLPVLADALEEAGCTNEEILNHCRQPGDHVRGCWVIDLVLGKN